MDGWKAPTFDEKIYDSIGIIINVIKCLNGIKGWQIMKNVQNHKVRKITKESYVHHFSQKRNAGFRIRFAFWLNCLRSMTEISFSLDSTSRQNVLLSKKTSEWLLLTCWRGPLVSWLQTSLWYSNIPPRSCWMKTILIYKIENRRILARKYLATSTYPLLGNISHYRSVYGETFLFYSSFTQISNSSVSMFPAK